LNPRVAIIGLRAPGAEGGIETVITETAPLLQQRSWDLSIFCRKRWNQHGSDWRGIKLINSPAVYTKHLETLTYASWSTLYASLHKFDLIHFHAIGPGALASIPRQLRIPSVLTVHGLDWRREKWGIGARLCLRLASSVASRNANTVVAVSQESTEWFRRRGVAAIHVPNGISPIESSPLEDAGVKHLKPGFKLYLGRLVPEKNIEVVLKAHKTLPHPGTLIIAGDTSHSDHYVRKLKRIAGPGVHFVGPKFGKAKAALLHHAEVMVFPSHLEGLPITMLEAMICGTPILASNIPPHRELLGESAPQLVFDNSPENWMHRLSSHTTAESQSSTLQAQKHAQEQYSWDPIVDRISQIYRDTIQMSRKTSCGNGAF